MSRPPRRSALLDPIPTPLDLRLGDCLDVLRTLPYASIDAVVTDPPYELAFMGKGWDASGIAFNVTVWQECLRVLKPGGYLLAFGGTRTYHRMTVAIEDAGFEVRDCLMWVYGSGFPKSLNVSIAIDKAAGAMGHRGKGITVAGYTEGRDLAVAHAMPKHEGVTDAARQWSGWGTALKPAWEPIVVARKPLAGTVAANVLEHGTGALNIDGCRVAFQSDADKAGAKPQGRATSKDKHIGAEPDAGNNEVRVDFVPKNNALGRWPANIILSHAPDCGEVCAPGCPCAAMDAQSDGAARFFNQLPIEAADFVPFAYVAKASRSEREAGCGEIPARSGAEVVDRAEGSAGAGRSADKVRNHHPTVKPVAVMRHLVRLVTRPGGTVLDPFMGSGTTGIAAIKENARFVGIEREPEYFAIAEARIKDW
jgi:DNA modification methylase